METKVVKRKKLNIARTLIFILVIYIIVCIGIYIYKEPVKHYEIAGNTFLSDVEILRYLDLTDFPAFASINTKKMENKLKSHPLIKDAKVKYNWDFSITIDINENRPMFLIKSTNQVCLADGTYMDYSNEYVGIPILLNATPDEILKALAKSLDSVDRGILYMISEIEYQPSYNSSHKIIDENRFLLSMNDKNLVYITAKKAKLLNEYLNIIAVKQITSNGTLYLDGNENRYTFDQFTTTQPTQTPNTTTQAGEPNEG